MKVSVIIPVYNCEQYLPVSLESVLNQTYSNLELILVDDGSTDDSYKICYDYAQIDPRVKVIKQPNSGSGPARNNGIAHTTGEYILFCDADDFYEVHALENFINGISSFDADLIISSYQEYKYSANGEIKISNEKRFPEKKINTPMEARKSYSQMCEMNMINAPWAKLYKTKIIKKYGIKFEDIRRCQDIVFNLRYFNHINSISVIDKVTYNYLTPDADIYLSKFPKDMSDIFQYINNLQVSALKEWGVFTNEAKRYFDTTLLRNVFICLRLNYENNWNFSKQEQKNYYKELLNNENILEIAECSSIDGFFNKIIQQVIRTRSEFLVKCLSASVLMVQKYLPRVISLTKQK